MNATDGDVAKQRGIKRRTLSDSSETYCCIGPAMRQARQADRRRRHSRFHNTDQSGSAVRRRLGLEATRAEYVAFWRSQVCMAVAVVLDVAWSTSLLLSADDVDGGTAGKVVKNQIRCGVGDLALVLTWPRLFLNLLSFMRAQQSAAYFFEQPRIILGDTPRSPSGVSKCCRRFVYNSSLQISVYATLASTVYCVVKLLIYLDGTSCGRDTDKPFLNRSNPITWFEPHGNSEPNQKIEVGLCVLISWLLGTLETLICKWHYGQWARKYKRHSVFEEVTSYADSDAGSMPMYPSDNDSDSSFATVLSSDGTDDAFHRWMTLSSTTPQSSTHTQAGMDDEESELRRPLLQSPNHGRVAANSTVVAAGGTSVSNSGVHVGFTVQGSNEDVKVDIAPKGHAFRRFVGRWKKDFQASDMNGMEKLMVAIGLPYIFRRAAHFVSIMDIELTPKGDLWLRASAGMIKIKVMSTSAINVYCCCSLS
mmetsp:Transcript_5825/g.21240  ORF Transcript_5825/g.21240 Transcript_5825/m.21240 type:complete len:478 (-) Transcript_5825:691-2124(-)